MPKTCLTILQLVADGRISVTAASTIREAVRQDAALEQKDSTLTMPSADSISQEPSVRPCADGSNHIFDEILRDSIPENNLNFLNPM
jgi:hypothetical protein